MAEETDNSVCRNCHSPILDQALYCYKCGNQLKCTHCKELLVEGAKNCVSCGTPVSSSNENNRNINQIKLRENKDGRWYDIVFTNDVGKEIKEVVADLLKNKIGLNYHEVAVPNVPAPKALNFSYNNNLTTEEATAPDLQSGAPGLTPEPQAAEVVPELNYPHLNDLDVRLSCTENEWLLIYAFYKSDFGTTTFSKEPIWQLYKDKRLTETRFKNLGTNWKNLFKKYLSTVKENEFCFTEQGLAKVKSLLLSESKKIRASRLPHQASLNNSKTISVGRQMPVSRKVVANSIAPDAFDVYKNNLKISLEEFFEQKQPGNSNPNRIVAIAYYITKINHQEYFTEGNIDFAYRILNLGGKPVHLKQIITNLKNERIWFKKILDQGIVGWRLTRQGEIYVEEKLLTS